MPLTSKLFQCLWIVPHRVLNNIVSFVFLSVVLCREMVRIYKYNFFRVGFFFVCFFLSFFFFFVAHLLPRALRQSHWRLGYSKAVPLLHSSTSIIICKIIKVFWMSSTAPSSPNVLWSRVQYVNSSQWMENSDKSQSWGVGDNFSLQVLLWCKKN